MWVRILHHPYTFFEKVMKKNNKETDKMNMDDFFMFNEDENLYSPNDDEEENELFYNELVNTHKMTHEEAVSFINSLQK